MKISCCTRVLIFPKLCLYITAYESEGKNRGRLACTVLSFAPELKKGAKKKEANKRFTQAH